MSPYQTFSLPQTDDHPTNLAERVYLIFFLTCFLCVGIYFRWECFDSVRITGWLTRDFDRAFHLFDGDYFPLAGPERNNGGRLLGPFLYIFLAIPLFFKYSYESIYAFNLILNFCVTALFFWTVRRFFGIATSIFSLSLLLVNLIHIDNVAFPINPSFMFHFVFLFFWFFFKFSLEKEQKYLPLMLISISLGIQMHFSIATYYLTVISACLIFQIKINWKTLTTALILTGICFFPYLLYKSFVYESNIKITEHFFNQDFSILRLIKTITVLNVLERITLQNHLYSFYAISKNVPAFEYAFSLICFYGLSAATTFNFLRRGFEACKKDISILLAFYIPAIIYEIMDPETGWHFWHYFIFVVPMILIKSRFIFFIISNLKKSVSKNFVIATFFMTFSFLAYENLSKAHKVNHNLKTILIFSQFHVSKNLSNFYGDLMAKLQLTPEELFNKVYIGGISAGSKKFIELAQKKPVQKLVQKYQSDECFYLFFSTFHSSKNNKLRIIAPEEFKRFSFLKNDPSVRIKSDSELILDMGSFQTKIIVHSYDFNERQSCYTNSSNSFLVSPETVEYLKQSYGIDKQVGEKTTPKKKEISQTTLGENWDKDIIFYDPKLKIPIKFKIALTQKNRHNVLYLNMFYYNWGKNEPDHFKIKKLDLKIHSTTQRQDNDASVYSIIDQQSWIARAHIDIPTERFQFWKKLEIPINSFSLKPNSRIELVGLAEFEKKNNGCCVEFNLELSP